MFISFDSQKINYNKGVKNFLRVKRDSSSLTRGLGGYGVAFVIKRFTCEIFWCKFEFSRTPI